MNLNERIRGMVSEQFGVPVDAIPDEWRLSEDLGADELDILELAMAIEEEFGKSIPDDAVEKFKTVGGIIQYCRDTLGIPD